MAPLSWSGSDVALNTIICTYIFSALAILFMTIHISMRIKYLMLEDYMTFFAFISTIILVGQITWAVVDEGQGHHMSDITQGQFELTAKVSYILKKWNFSDNS